MCNKTSKRFYPSPHVSYKKGYSIQLCVQRNKSISSVMCLCCCSTYILPICMYCIRSNLYKFHADFHPPKQQPKKYTQGKIKPTIYNISQTRVVGGCAASLYTYNRPTARKSISIQQSSSCKAVGRQRKHLSVSLTTNNKPPNRAQRDYLYILSPNFKRAPASLSRQSRQTLLAAVHRAVYHMTQQQGFSLDFPLLLYNIQRPQLIFSKRKRLFPPFCVFSIDSSIAYYYVQKAETVCVCCQWVSIWKPTINLCVITMGKSKRKNKNGCTYKHLHT